MRRNTLVYIVVDVGIEIDEIGEIFEYI